MASKKNEARILKVGEIEKNPILSLGTSGKDVQSYERVTKAYGNVTPTIVSKSQDAYRILAGQAGLLACARNGIREMPVIVAEIDGEAEQMKLALLLSTVKENGGSLCEGAFIDALITHHGISRRELMSLLKKSRSWISKRQSLALRLTENVREMVKDGVICARSAEEIARLPKDIQVSFATMVSRDSLSKTDTHRLAGLYLREEPGSALREAILSSPLAVLDACPTASLGRQKEKRGMAERICGNAGFIIRMAYEIKGLLATANEDSLCAVASELNHLSAALADLCSAIELAIKKVSPGKQEGGAGL